MIPIFGITRGVMRGNIIILNQITYDGLRPKLVLNMLKVSLRRGYHKRVSGTVRMSALQLNARIICLVIKKFYQVFLLRRRRTP